MLHVLGLNPILRVPEWNLPAPCNGHFWDAASIKQTSNATVNGRGQNSQPTPLSNPKLIWILFKHITPSVQGVHVQNFVWISSARHSSARKWKTRFHVDFFVNIFISSFFCETTGFRTTLTPNFNTYYVLYDVFSNHWCLLGLRKNLEKPKIHQKWELIGILKSSMQNVKTCISSKLLHQFQPKLHNNKDHQVLFMGGPNMHTTIPRWQTGGP